MAITPELRQGLDRHLASQARAPACIGVDGGLVFETAAQLHACALMSPDGGLELFAVVGAVRAEMLDAIVRADEDEEFDEVEASRAADAVARWPGEGAQWAVAVERRTGRVTLSMFVTELPAGPDDWASLLAAFGRMGASWAARLRCDARDPHDPHPRFAGITLLRC